MAVWLQLIGLCLALFFTAALVLSLVSMRNQVYPDPVNQTVTFRSQPEGGDAANTTRQISSSPSPFLPLNSIEAINALPAAFGDFDSDHYTDILLIGDQGKSIELLRGMSCVGQ